MTLAVGQGCRWKRLAVVLACGLFIAACGDDEQGASVGGDVTELRARWVLVSPRTDADLELRYEGGDSCTVLERVDVTETAETVELAVILKRTAPPEGEACQELLRIGRAEARLEKPLGDRTLIGECDDPDCHYLRSRSP